MHLSLSEPALANTRKSEKRDAVVATVAALIFGLKRSRNAIKPKACVTTSNTNVTVLKVSLP